MSVAKIKVIVSEYWTWPVLKQHITAISTRVKSMVPLKVLFIRVFDDSKKCRFERTCAERANFYHLAFSKQYS